MSDERKSYGQIAYERFKYWSEGRIEPAWSSLSLGTQDDWEEAAEAAVAEYIRQLATVRP